MNLFTRRKSKNSSFNMKRKYLGTFDSVVKLLLESFLEFYVEM